LTAALRYLLDTNILSDLVRKPHGRIRERIIAAGESTTCTSIISAGELRFGGARAGSPSLMERIDRILSALVLLPFDSPADRHYAEIRTTLAREGTLIGPNDLLIAAQARSLNLTVVTANDREFSRVPDLRVVNWLRH